MKSNHWSFAAGLLVGAALFGGTAAAAAGILAEPSRQTFYLGDEPIQLEAYAINGNNYVKLRDVGQVVDFNVTYDGSRNAVVIDPDAGYSAETPPPASTPAPQDGVVIVPQSDALLTLKEGDKVLCDDGTLYEIKDMRLYDPPAPLPTPACDWSQSPDLELPQVVVRRFNNEYGDNLYILNLYETRRMQYTIYNAVPNCPGLWEGGTLVRDAQGQPILRLQLGITETGGTQYFWPWRDEQLTRVFYSAPGMRFAVEAWDVYHNGKFLQTRYNIQAK